MAALTQPRNTRLRKGGIRSFPLAAVKAIAGGIAVLNTSGFAEPATAATGKKILGMFEETVDNSGGNAGDKSVKIRNMADEVYPFVDGEAPAAADLADVGAAVYADDDQTVVLEATGRSQVGTIDFVDSDGIHVKFG